MNYRVVIAHEAEMILDRLDRPTEQRIRTRIIQLADGPFDPRLSAPLTERAASASRVSAAGGFCLQRTTISKTLFVFTVDTRGQVYKHS